VEALQHRHVVVLEGQLVLHVDQVLVVDALVAVVVHHGRDDHAEQVHWLAHVASHLRLHQETRHRLPQQVPQR
jgi:hypothetical protein